MNRISAVALEDAGCAKSKRVAYFFYPRKPSTAIDMGTGFVEVAVTAGGGWALEVDFKQDSVSKASWVKLLKGLRSARPAGC